MKLWKKGLAMYLCICAISSLWIGSAMAAEDRTKITRIRLNIESSIEVGTDNGGVSVTTEDGEYSVDEVEVLNDEGEWLDGDVPRVKITLWAKSGYYFSSKSSSVFRFDGDDAEYTSASITSEKEEMAVTVKLDALVGSLEIESAGWEEEESPVAVWEEADGAKSYQVRLYRGSNSVTELLTTNTNSFNFANYITKTGEYTFKVRAVNNSSKRGSYAESDTFDVDETTLNTIKSGYYGSGSNGSTGVTPGTNSGSWILDQVGWWYRNGDGSYTKNGWQVINNVWYAFDQVGYMRTGWIPWNGVWYYCDTKSGAMLTNTYTPDGYWVNGNGVWVNP